MHPKDQKNTDFITPWGEFMYSKMPFGLMNAGETFQREMDTVFSKEKDKFLVSCLDDIILYFESDEKHLKHLEEVFQKCILYGVSLNPKKYNFAMKE